jgi:hypothetical protein
MPSRSALLDDFAARYIWWRDGTSPSEDRIIAQVMNRGTWDDIRRLEGQYTPGDLRGVMLRAAAGWIDARPWSFWRRRLHARGAGPIPEEPPRRSFYAEVP